MCERVVCERVVCDRRELRVRVLLCVRELCV